MDGWPTPRSQDSKHGSCTTYELGRDKGKDLLHVRIQREEERSWPTPHASCSTGAGRQGRQGGANLQTSVAEGEESPSEKMWPTAAARDWKDSPGMSRTGVNPDGSTRERTDQLARAVYALGHQGQDNSNSGGSHPESYPRPKQWRTPNAQLIEPKPEGTKLEGRTPQDPQVGLADQVAAESKKGREAWPTPVVTDSIGAGNRNLEGSKAHAGSSLTDIVNGGQKSRKKEDRNQGKLNARWVETLMGVPVGWTMPSCTRPVTIEPTN